MPYFKQSTLCTFFPKFSVTFESQEKNVSHNANESITHLSNLFSVSCKSNPPFSGHCSNLFSSATEVQETWSGRGCLGGWSLSTWKFQIYINYKLTMCVFLLQTWPFAWNPLIVNICHSRKLWCPSYVSASQLTNCNSSYIVPLLIIKQVCHRKNPIFLSHKKTHS